MLERVGESVLLVLAVQAGFRALGISTDDGLRQIVGAHRRPVVAIALTAALAGGAAISLVRPQVVGDLARTDGGAWWRTFTAPFVQLGGVTGAAFNVVTALVVVALAEWAWGARWGAVRGSLGAALVWLVGAWAPVGSAAGLVGYRVSAEHVTAYSAGSSGATYFLAGALVATTIGRTRLLALAAPAFGLGLAVVLGDGHGVLLDAGFVAGLVLVVGERLYRSLRRARHSSARIAKSSSVDHSPLNHSLSTSRAS